MAAGLVVFLNWPSGTVRIISLLPRLYHPMVHIGIIHFWPDSGHHHDIAVSGRHLGLLRRLPSGFISYFRAAGGRAMFIFHPFFSCQRAVTRVTTNTICGPYCRLSGLVAAFSSMKMNISSHWHFFISAKGPIVVLDPTGLEAVK